MINGHPGEIVREVVGPAIHPLAYVHDDCEVGSRTRVWQWASVIRRARIGEDCSIATCAIVDGSRLGDRVIVSHSAFIDPGMLIGNDVFIGPHVNMCNDYWPKVTKEGWFDTEELIKGKIIVTVIESHASVGAGATLMPGITIGRNSLVAAGAVVDKNVPPDSLFKRDGSIIQVDPDRLPNRMRLVMAAC